MLLEYYSKNLDFAEDDWHETLMFLWGDDSPHESTENLEDAFKNYLHQMPDQLTEVSLKSIANVAGDIGRTVAKAAPGVLRTAAPIIGTALLGPAGTVLGGIAGQALGSIVGGTNTGSTVQSGTSQMPSSSSAPPSPAAALGQTNVSIGAPSYATTPTTDQLLILINNPHLLVPLLRGGLSQVSNRAEEIQLGETVQKFPPSAILNALSILAERAAMEMSEREQELESSYLMDSNGQYLVDPANPEQRAEMLLNKLYWEAELMVRKK